jgi:hypothetical protein
MSLISPETDNKKLWFFIVLSAILSILSLISFFIGLSGYTRPEFIEHNLNLLRGREHVWLPILLFLPFMALLIGIPILVRKAHKDDDTALFYSFCLSLMSLSPLSYCVLWSVYVLGIGHIAPSTLDSLSKAALVLVGVLVSTVIYMTYLTMWTPSEASPFLKLSDIKDWKAFCDRLIKQRNPLSDNGQFGLLDRFPNRERELILEAPHSLSMRSFQRDLMRPVIATLNELMTHDNFLDANEFVDLPAGNDAIETLVAWQNNELSPASNEVYLLHRMFLDTAYMGIIKPLNKDGRLRSKIRNVRNRLKNFQTSLKEGVIKSPFWATVFFFTIFLGITYLFGFAFAFHDQANLRLEKKPALFSRRSPLYDVGAFALGTKPSSGTSTGNDEGKPSADMSKPTASRNSWPDYVFYFETPHAQFVHKDQFEQENFQALFATRSGTQGSDAPRKVREGSESSNRKSIRSEPHFTSDKLRSMHDDWKHWKNSIRLSRLVKAIALADDATHGQGLQILIRGAADEKRLDAKEQPGVSYPSNYTLSEARAHSIEYVLRERLADSGKLPSNFQWVLLPMSNEVTTIPKSPETTETDKQRGVPTFDEEIGDEGRRNDFNRGTHRQILSTQLGRIRDLTSKGKLAAAKDQSEVLRQLKLAVDLDLEPDKVTEEEQLAQIESRQQAADALSETIEAVRDEHLDEDASKRIVVVSIKPMQQNATNLFAPLGLVDYLYFTIYTITTTGYGDIVPTTPYAKFLCSSANILEVFFFVVFFNGLLSVNRGRGRPKVERGSHRRVGNEKTPTPQTSSNGAVNSPDLATSAKLLSENQKTLEEVRGLLQQLSTRSWVRRLFGL